MEEFIPPPEAPVFQPTLAEFKDTVAYISKIPPVVVNTGICKIRPPQAAALDCHPSVPQQTLRALQVQIRTVLTKLPEDLQSYLTMTFAPYL